MRSGGRVASNGIDNAQSPKCTYRRRFLHDVERRLIDLNNIERGWYAESRVAVITAGHVVLEDGWGPVDVVTRSGLRLQVKASGRYTQWNAAGTGKVSWTVALRYEGIDRVVLARHDSPTIDSEWTYVALMPDQVELVGQRAWSEATIRRAGLEWLDDAGLAAHFC